MSRRGEMGAGVLIGLIALLVVAASSIMVLVQTSSSMKQKVLVGGEQTADYAASGVQVISIHGADGSTELENLTIVLALNADSQSIDFNAFLIEVHTHNTTTFYVYAATYSVNGENGTYNLTYVHQGNNFLNGMLGSGDLVEVYLQTPRPLHGLETVRMRFLPAHGMTTTASFSIPDTTTNKNIRLYL